MKSLTRLPAKALEYYINARRWKTHLDFFNMEVVFLNRIMEEHFLQLAGDNHKKKITPLGSKLSVLMNEKYHVDGLLDQQLKKLELLAEGLLRESPEELAGKQAHLEYHIIDLIHEYREVKRELYTIVEVVLNERKLLV
ncbi:hypothetical protein OQX61_14160 [Pedobacter sp. PLR]|uniref:hypothetical protein n=1 Tax=Pedobacter sp. PLR TaxID=2994465 RepID=UPI0022454969|nr:hypothetical protein [Pedobacter sp. PLR]MCX2452415.1 hypothetical protein [Pedobacter sp. PLR]